MGDVAARIESKLQKAFTPSTLSVVDDSHLHADHAGARPGGQSHFTVEITASRFDGLTRVARHRLVNEALTEELAGPVHALVIRARASTE
ncbi:BolA family transcriptional regulator [uncultured Maricaulis sp.]|uniref:BolA family protein n=1 Tax=uncultured Maricaulis sp. TaxID=174710 RepID=UPI0025FC599C|nr:BolA family protein [uncultured Maricaulis sp.]